MNKDRLGAFMDAVIAIVMTILVLELDKPAAPTLQAFWDLRINFAEYALSFLWLAAMWTSLHNAWHVVDKISGRTMWLSMGLLFFSSLFLREPLGLPGLIGAVLIIGSAVFSELQDRE